MQAKKEKRNDKKKKGKIKNKVMIARKEAKKNKIKLKKNEKVETSNTADVKMSGNKECNSKL